MKKYCYDGQHPLLDEKDNHPIVKGPCAEMPNKITTLDPRLRVSNDDDICEFYDNGEIQRVPYKLLKWQRRLEFDKAVVQHAQWQVTQWLKISDKMLDSIYNKEAIKEEYTRCLDQWSDSKNFPMYTNKCGPAELLQGIYKGRISLLGKNNCLSTLKSAPLKLGAGKGWNLKIDRLHSVWSDGEIRRTILSWHGNVYIFRFEKDSPYFGCLGYDGTGPPNSMTRRADYQTIMSVLNSKLLGKLDKHFKPLVPGSTIGVGRIDNI
ncbi:hypothetical protein GcM1_106007 [Golovinomyces cichoracearum]|uniref:Uncharacterized protein n=1 Tax=Golovinomyces cichoracearum TaxID=62708 RepID=A0A420JC91_9PEZI|nr:hypothetical protein GcM1_106007 [Golovinomyces cichoracearum]